MIRKNNLAYLRKAFSKMFNKGFNVRKGCNTSVFCCEMKVRFSSWACVLFVYMSSLGKKVFEQRIIGKD